MNKILRSFTFQIAITVVLGVTLGAGYARWQEQLTPPEQPNQAAIFQGPPQGTGQQTGSQRPVVGTVEAVENNRVVIRNEGGTTAANVSNSTAIRKIEPIARADLSVGASVLVMGSAAADGAIEAASVQVLAADGERSLGGATGGRQRGGSEREGVERGGLDGSRGFASGTIEQLTDGGFTVKAPSGLVTVRVSAQTAFRRQTEAKLTDLKAGERVTLIAEAGPDGSLVARSIQVGEFSGGPSRRS